MNKLAWIKRLIKKWFARSQFGEDALLSKLLPDNGYFVDIGAFIC